MNEIIRKKLLQIKDISELLITAEDTHHIPLQARSTLAEVVCDLADELVEYSSDRNLYIASKLEENNAQAH